jgi:hypothetical protein
VKEVNAKSHLKIADHGIENGGLRSKYYFMGLPALGAIHDGKIRELARIKGTADISISSKTRIMVYHESVTHHLRVSIGLTGAT